MSYPKPTVLLVVLASLALAAPAVATGYKPRRHRPLHLTMQRGEAAIRDYAERDHPTEFTLTSCHRKTPIAVSCIVSDNGVWVLMHWEGGWQKEAITYRATANLLKDNTLLIETTRGIT